MLNVLCLWIFIFFWMRELKFEKKMCIKVIMLNDFRLRWNGDIWLLFFNKVMFLYRYFLLFFYMQNMYMKYSCMFFSLNDRYVLLIIVCYNNRIMIIIFICNFSIYYFVVLYMYILCSCYFKECQFIQLCFGYNIVLRIVFFFL